MLQKANKFSGHKQTQSQMYPLNPFFTDSTGTALGLFEEEDDSLEPSNSYSLPNQDFEDNNELKNYSEKNSDIDDEHYSIILNFAKELTEDMKDLDREIISLVNKNFWDLI